MNLEAIKTFAHSILHDDTTAHDWKHALRVEQNAREITPHELADSEKEIVLAAAWLHDTIDEKIVETKRQTPETIRVLLEEQGATPYQIDEILTIIQNLSYSKNLEEKRELSKLGQIVQDADRLDALGAIGIARAFYYGGSNGQPLYDETMPRPVDELTEKAYREGSSVINHFYEKLLLLEDQMNTVKGTAEAIKRTRFIREFIEEFYRNIEG